MFNASPTTTNRTFIKLVVEDKIQKIRIGRSWEYVYNKT